MNQHSLTKAHRYPESLRRALGISLSIVLQSIAQLPARYGKDYALSIMGGFNTFLTYSGADQTTAEFFQAIGGKVVEEGKNRPEHIISQRREYNLLNADAVRRISNTQAVMVSTNKNPAVLETVPYFAHRRYARIPKRFGTAHLGSRQASRNISKVPLK